MRTADHESLQIRRFESLECSRETREYNSPKLRKMRIIGRYSVVRIELIEKGMNEKRIKVMKDEFNERVFLQFILMRPITRIISLERLSAYCAVCCNDHAKNRCATWN